MTTLKTRSPKTCPVCNSTSRQLFDKSHYVIRGCQVCGHQFVDYFFSGQHSDDVYSDDYFKGDNANSPHYLNQGKFLKLKGRRYARLIQHYMKQPGRVLDVGAAAGFMLQGFLDRDWQGSGLEPNRKIVDHAHQMGLRVIRGTLETIETEEKYDLINMIQVIAHFTDVQQAFQNAASMTRSNGFWLIETGDRDSLSARVLGEHWQEYNPPNQLHWFSAKDLQRLAAQFGFQEVARGKPRKWMNAGHAKFCLRHQKHRSFLDLLTLIALTFVPNNVPLPFSANDHFWVIYKKLW
ncbi:MAG: class I SAM-dependent methyltransferase [Oculatellaceae cyanobacterium Prado106]|jgi:SAM-dependent methyltransferase|nr:class I SAM-dependent methyltransferase [Oculatellaceae cyanobacterium Prado106]